ncbi:SMP-30/gluconolactonase/LRE family protein [Rhodococcus sp. NPDC127530]|uniref:SMP-30/gluconolactonase/LRE family protein n=1 Tax=unclassified Rhodococcus (in: high G+C Gram-positive bacteria) TaxID=192944 RepID=UPI00363880FC
MTYAIDAPFEFRDKLGEGPHWDDKTGTLLRVDALGGRIHRLEPDSGRNEELLSVSGEVGFVVPTTDGRIVATVVNELVELGADGPKKLAAVDEGNSDLRINDGKCDSRGRVVFGTISAARAPVGALHRFDSSGRHEVLATGISVSNGMGWDESLDRFYYIDSWTQCIDVFDYDVSNGDVGGRRPFVEIPQEEGLPDGMAIDSEGGVWVALFGAGEVRRYAPDGSISERVSLPATYVTSIAFGGADLKTAYVTSGYYEYDAAQREEEPLAGAILTFSAGVAGVRGATFDQPVG